MSNLEEHNKKMNKRFSPERVDAEWLKEAREIMKTRLTRGMANFNLRDLSISEYTRLQRRAPSYPKLVEELKTMPKRENVKNLF